jgi:hypothetical protein
MNPNNRFAVAVSIAIASSLATTMSQVKASTVQEINTDALQFSNGQIADQKISSNVDRQIKLSIDKIEIPTPSERPRPRPLTIMCGW